MNFTLSGYKLLLREVERLLWDFLSQDGHTREEYIWAEKLEKYFTSKKFADLNLNAKVIQLRNSKKDILSLIFPDDLDNSALDCDFEDSRYVKGSDSREDRNRRRKDEMSEINSELCRLEKAENEKKAKAEAKRLKEEQEAKEAFEAEKRLMPEGIRLIRKQD